MTTTLGDWLAEQPFTLGLTSGFFGFFAHCGVVRALEEAGLRPSRLRGSSAGALVGGLYAAGLHPEAMAEELVVLQRADFWDPGPGLGRLRGRRFRERLGRILPVRRFEDCPRALAVSVFHTGTLATRVVERGDLGDAIAASCTFPLLFQPRWVGGMLCLDGGVLDRPGLAGAPTGERLLIHHLASRSPWRRPSSPSLTPPRRDNGVALVVAGLPRLGPFRLERGPEAIETARRATHLALRRPLGEASEEVATHVSR
ncbi:MAG: patatin-like phospholipase family protein [Myxococcales bacterium]|nr:patatin-like phospholipase family protein [Myxococcales bacterium]